jgi:hypothetical protein
MEHSVYPHVHGYLYGCQVCETQCFCDEDVAAGLAMECIYCEENHNS